MGQYLNERLAKGRHDKGGVEVAESANGAHGQLADLKHLVVQGHEECTQVLSLGQVAIKAVVQGGQDTVTDVRIWGRLMTTVQETKSK